MTRRFWGWELVEGPARAHAPSKCLCLRGRLALRFINPSTTRRQKTACKNLASSKIRVQSEVGTWVTSNLEAVFWSL